MPRATATRGRRSKPEVQQEFEEIREHAQAAKEATSTKAEELGKLKEAEVRQAVEGVSIDGVVQRIGGLGIEITKALGDVSEKLLSEVKRLADLREAAAIETKELERLHKVDIAATALDQLIEEYRVQKERLEAEIAAQRAAWGEETERRARELREADEVLRKQRQRETEEYEYKKALERKKAQDKYDEEVRLLEKKNLEKQETLEKSWYERETALKAREQELAQLKKEAEELPVRLKKDVDKAVAEATKSAEARFEQQLAFLKKDAEGEKRVAVLQIKSLEATVANQAGQIEALAKQLDEAKKQVQDIAVKAIEGASGAKALERVNQIAIEQAKMRGTQG